MNEKKWNASVNNQTMLSQLYKYVNNVKWCIKNKIKQRKFTKYKWKYIQINK